MTAGSHRIMRLRTAIKIELARLESGQLDAEAALVVLGDDRPLRLVALVKERQPEGHAEIAKDVGVLGPGDHGAGRHHGRDVAGHEAAPGQIRKAHHPRDHAPAVLGVVGRALGEHDLDLGVVLQVVELGDDVPAVLVWKNRPAGHRRSRHAVRDDPEEVLVRRDLVDRRADFIETGGEVARPRAIRALTHPAVALPLWLANYMLWHLPWLYDTALEHPHSLLHLEHALYFSTGVAMWWSVVQFEPHRIGAGARAGVVFAAFVLGSPIGLVLALVPDAIYDFYVDAPERLWGLSALEDQQLAGLLMAVEQAVVFFAVFAFWFLRFLAEEERRADIDRPTEAA